MKYGDPEKTGWSPRRRFRFGYFLPADYYEALVRKLVRRNSYDWIDVGGGKALFPTNSKLAQEVAAHSRSLVGVDPSENINANPYLHGRVQSRLEDYQTDARFDLATLRMVAEHVSDPKVMVSALECLVRPGGIVVILTPHLWSFSTFISRLLPNAVHAPIAKLFWRSEDEDVFPTVYRMNRRVNLDRWFSAAGFTNLYFTYLDDLSIFGRFKWLSYVELLVWKVLNGLGLHYPENCILAVYGRDRAE